MTRHLLDTNVALITLSEPALLSRTVYEAVASGQNYLSVLSYWEVLLKSMKGKLDVGDPRVWWTQSLLKLNATALQLTPLHLNAVYSLPAIHKDPFDRALIAQAIEEDLTLVTTDAKLSRYALEPSLNLQVIH